MTCIYFLTAVILMCYTILNSAIDGLPLGEGKEVWQGICPSLEKYYGLMILIILNLNLYLAYYILGILLFCLHIKCCLRAREHII